MSLALLNQALPFPWMSRRLHHHHRHRRHEFIVILPVSSFLSCSSNPRVLFHDAIAAGSSRVEVSWTSSSGEVTHCDADELGGWGFVVEDDAQFPEKNQKPGFQMFLFWGIGVLIVVLVAAAFRFKMARRGFKLPFPRQLHALRDTRLPSSTETKQQEVGDSGTSTQDKITSEAVEVEFTDTVSNTSIPEEFQPRIIPMAVDSTQLEALSALKALKGVT